MNYKISDQYARGEETFIAEFNASHDADTFLNKKMTIDQAQHKKKIYRLYRDTDLLREFNPETISVTHAKYADGDVDACDSSPFLFHVTRLDQRNLERTILAYFHEANDALLFMTEKCETDSSVNDDHLFLLLKDRVLINTLNKMIIAHHKIESDGSKARQSMATFNPTPIPTRPTPPGGPSDCWIEPDEE